MGPGTLDERHLGSLVSAKPISQPGHKLQPCRTAANNHDLVK
jgi:predicted HD phosphohydrolase